MARCCTGPSIFEATQLAEAAAQEAEDALAQQIALLESQPGVELGFAERLTSYTNTQTTVGAAALIPSFAFTIIGSGRPVDIEFNAPNCYHSVANTAVTLYWQVNGSAIDARAHSGSISSPATANPGRNICLRRRVVLLAGVSYLFEFGAFGGAAGTTTLVAATYSAITCGAVSR